jgi:multiple sugar transport system substrate-binding protein
MASVTRRRLLKGVLLAGGSAAALGLLAACGGGTAAPTSAPATQAAQPTSAPAAATPTQAAAGQAAASPTAAAAAATPQPTTAAGGASPTAAATTAAQPAAAGSLTMTQYALNNAKLTAWAWQSFSPDADKWIADQSTAWGKQNGGTVEYDVVQNSVFPQKLAAAIEAKTVPDVIMLSDTLYYQGLNILTDLTDEYNKLDKLQGGFYKSLLPGIQVDGKIWGIPIETGPSPLFTRLDIVQQATGKREPPKTLDEMEDIGKKVNKPPSFYAIGLTLGRTPDGDGNVSDIMLQDGGFKVNKEGTKPTIMSDGTIAAMTRIKRWWDEKLIPPDSISWDDTGNNNAYQSKRVAFVDNPASIYGWMIQNDKDLLGNSSMAPMPAGKAGSFSGGAGGWSWSVYNGSKGRDAAIAMIDFLEQPDNLEMECEQVGGRWFPPYQELANKDFWKSKPQFSYYPQLITNAVYGSYPAPPEPKLMAALGEAGTGLVIADMAQAIVVNNTPIEKAVQDAQAKFEAIFKKHGLG